MSTELNQPKDNYPPLNGGGTVVTSPNPNPNPCTHKPEDFSQSAINAGQRRINYDLAAANMRLIEAVTQLKDVLTGLYGGRTLNFTPVTKTLNEASLITNGVAETIPPGCDPPPPPKTPGPIGE